MMSETVSVSDALGAFCKLQQSVRGGVKLGYDHDVKSRVAKELEFDVSDKSFKPGQYNLVSKSLRSLSNQAPFAIGGCVRLKRGAKYELFIKPETSGGGKSSAKTLSNFMSIGDTRAISVNKLLDQCVQSPFGDLLNNVTKIDPSVRLAMECPGSRVKFERTDPVSKENQGRRDNDFIGVIADAVQTALTSDAVAVKVLLNKINVYSAGGHFQPHTDTPTHDPSRFLGSVVVCLPSQHTGGDLVVKHAGQQCVTNFANSSAVRDIIQFAAFYGDCKHQVLPVTSGHRVTVTYSIVKTDKQRFRWNSKLQGMTVNMSDIQKSNGSYAAHTNNALRGIMDALCKKFENGHCGIYLSHTYTESGLRAANLKGEDRLLYEYLVRNDIPVSLLAVASSLYYERYDCEDYDPDKDGKNDRQLPQCQVRLLSGFADPRHDAHKNISTNIPFLTRVPVDVIAVKDDEQPSYNAGNEIVAGSVDRLYIKGAMIVGPFPLAAPIQELEQDFSHLRLADAATSDLTIVVGKAHIPTHKTVLCAKSPVFKAMFQHQMLEIASSQIVISDFAPTVVQTFLRCLYYDSAALADLLNGDNSSSDGDFVLELFAIAHKYEVTSVTRAIECYMVSNINVDNALSLLLFADLHSLESVKLAAMQTIVANAEHFFEHTPKLMKLLGGRLMGELCKYMARRI